MQNFWYASEISDHVEKGWLTSGGIRQTAAR